MRQYRARIQAMFEPEQTQELAVALFQEIAADEWVESPVGYKVNEYNEVYVEFDIVLDEGEADSPALMMDNAWCLASNIYTNATWSLHVIPKSMGLVLTEIPDPIIEGATNTGR